VRTRIERSWLRQQQGRLEEAYGEAKAALDLVAAGQDRQHESGALHALAVCCARSGRAAEALESAVRLVQLQPGSADFHVLHARALVQMGRLAEVHQPLQKAIGICGDHAEARSLITQYGT